MIYEKYIIVNNNQLSFSSISIVCWSPFGPQYSSYSAWYGFDSISKVSGTSRTIFLNYGPMFVDGVLAAQMWSIRLRSGKLGGQDIKVSYHATQTHIKH